MWIEVEGGELYVESCGSGVPLLLIHGWALDHRMFRPQVDGLCRSFQVITYDRRGFGRSTAPPDLRLEPDDIDRILEALDVDTTHLLGMSQGGRIALRYAVRRGHRLRSLILQGAVVDGLQVEEHESERVPVTDYAELAKAGRMDEVRHRWRQHPMMAIGPECAEESRLIEQILADYDGADLIGFDPGSYAFDEDTLSALSVLDLPALILTGTEETRARKRHAQTLCHVLRDATEKLLPGSGHLSNLTSAREYNKLVEEFCQRVDSGQSSQEAALRME